MTKIEILVEESWNSITEITGLGIRRRGFHASRVLTSDLKLPIDYNLAKSAISSIGMIHQVYHSAEATIAANVLPALVAPTMPKLLTPTARE